MDGGETDRPPVFSRQQARATGLTDRQVDRRLSTGKLQALRRGALVWPETLTPERTSKVPPTGDVSSAEDLGPELYIRAAVLSSRDREIVVSHASAAGLWELPRPLPGWPRPQFTTTSPPGRRRGGIHIRVAPLQLGDVVEHKGMLVTNPARTVVDCLRTLSAIDGLAVLDRALHLELVSEQDVLDMLNRQQGWPGIVIARDVLMLGDSLRESPLESWSAWAFARMDISKPIWQVDIREPNGHLVGRADCWWPGVAGEADGRSKYALAAAERGGNAEAVYRVLQEERLREQRFRDLGADVVRWSATDVLDPSRSRKLADRLRGAIARADQGARFTGRLERRQP